MCTRSYPASLATACKCKYALHRFPKWSVASPQSQIWSQSVELAWFFRKCFDFPICLVWHHPFGMWCLQLVLFYTLYSLNSNLQPFAYSTWSCASKPFSRPLFSALRTSLQSLTSKDCCTILVCLLYCVNFLSLYLGTPVFTSASILSIVF